MTIEEMLSTSTLHASKPAARYLLRAVNPVTGQSLDSRYLTMDAALAKVAELLPDEYSIEIWSSAALESHAQPRRPGKRKRTDRDRRRGLAISALADAGRSHGGF